MSGPVALQELAPRWGWFADDRQQQQLGRDDPAVPAATITTSYDPAGNPTSITDSSGGGSTVTATYYLDDSPRTVGDGTRTTRAAYDGGGTRYVRRDDTGSATYPTSYALNDAGLATTVKADGFAGYNGATTEAFTYDAAGRLTQRTDQDTRITTSTYNPDDTLAQVRFANPDGTNLATWAYAYRNDGRVSSQTYTGLGAAGSGVSTTNEVFAYGYDAAGRLSSFTAGTDPTRPLAWDHDSNRTSYVYKDSTNTTYTVTQAYNADDSVKSRTDQFGTSTPTYFPWGGMKGDCTAYTYDGFDRLASDKHCQLPNPVTHTYDGLDRPRSADAGDGAGVSTLHYDGLSQDLAMETSASGVDTLFELGPAGTPLARAVKSASPPQVDILNDDGQGDITTVTNIPIIACTARFDPFGTPLSTTHADIGFTASACNTGASTNDRLFKGARRQGNDGDYTFGSRSYDPRRATFLTPDSYRTGDSDQNLSVGVDPLTRNTYSYVNGDPVNLMDPDGHGFSLRRLLRRAWHTGAAAAQDVAHAAGDAYDIGQSYVKGVVGGAADLAKGVGSFLKVAVKMQNTLPDIVAAGVQHGPGAALSQAKAEATFSVKTNVAAVKGLVHTAQQVAQAVDPVTIAVHYGAEARRVGFKRAAEDYANNLGHLTPQLALLAGTGGAGSEAVAAADDAEAIGTALGRPGFDAAEGVEGGVPALRQAYVDDVASISDNVAAWEKAGADPEFIAREAWADRRALGIQYKGLTPPDMLEEIYARNIAKYGDPLGPSIDWLRGQGKTWQQIIESATRTGGRDLGF